MGCINSNTNSSESPVEGSINVATALSRSPHSQSAAELTQKRGSGEGVDGVQSPRNSARDAFGSKVSTYTRSVKKLVNDGLVLQPEFDNKGVKQPHLRLRDVRETSTDTEDNVKMPMDMDGLMQVSHEERANRRRDMTVTFRKPSSYPNLAKMFSTQAVPLSDLTWDLDCFAADKNQQEWQINATLAMFNSLGLLSKYDISVTHLVRFLLTVKLNYNDNPFHNWMHAWSVMHASWLMISAPDIKDCLTDGDKLAVMVAAVCHDLDHPGVNNDYLSKSNDPLSIRYKSPILERHHLSMTMEILCDPSKRADITEALKQEEHEELVKMIDAAIMATDMGVHKSICEDLQKRAEKVVQAAQSGKPLEKPLFSIDSYDDRVFLVRSIVHTADLSGQAMPKEVAYKFGGGVLSEFHLQYCQEASRNLPLSGWMKDLDLPIGQAKSQLGFITFVVLPLWASMGTIFASLRAQADRVQARMVEIDFENVDKWEGFTSGLEPCMIGRAESGGADGGQEGGKKEGGKEGGKKEGGKEGEVKEGGEQGGEK